MQLNKPRLMLSNLTGVNWEHWCGVTDTLVHNSFRVFLSYWCFFTLISVVFRR